MIPLNELSLDKCVDCRLKDSDKFRKKLKTVYFKKNKFLSERTCVECNKMVSDGMYVSHAQKFHNTNRVILE